MAMYGVGQRVTWTVRGVTKTGTIRAVVAAGESLDVARSRALDENGELDTRRLRITRENRTSGNERYLIEVPRLSTRGAIPEWVMPATKVVDGQVEEKEGRV